MIQGIRDHPNPSIAFIQELGLRPKSTSHQQDKRYNGAVVDLAKDPIWKGS